MIRLIKRYESRKLYDTEESRYVSLQEIAAFVRAGQQVMVVESASGEDVTTPTLAQIILEEGRSGERRWSSETLHELLRRGERVVQETLRTGAEQVQQGVEGLLRSSLGRLEPVREASVELDRLRDRLGELEEVLERFESSRGDDAAAAGETSPGTAKSPVRKKKAVRNKKAAARKRTSQTGKTSGRKTPTRGASSARRARSNTRSKSGGET